MNGALLASGAPGHAAFLGFAPRHSLGKFMGIHCVHAPRAPPQEVGLCSCVLSLTASLTVPRPFPPACQSVSQSQSEAVLLLYSWTKV